MNKKDIIRIGIFYDGNFFFHVSSYYRYVHPPKKRISISGLHNFIKNKIAEFEKVESNLVHIVTSHFFRGRLSAKDAELEDRLYSERVFEDILMNEGVITHYLPIKVKSDKRHERGIDVWLALEAYDTVIQKKLDVLVLITGDADFIPLVKKAQSANAKVMLLGWDFKYTDESGVDCSTITSAELLESSTYPLNMHNLIEKGLQEEDNDILNLFYDIKEEQQESQTKIKEYFQGKIHSLKEGYGFISCQKFPKNVFFHYSALKNQNFQDLVVGQKVEFLVHEADKGIVAQPVIVINNPTNND
ncbi:MAG TPA: NYN domain-containing protein [Candidatus Hydrogenedens sp.]|nr:NYN domain-containing protein [Candidatus Hydrogenedens sp.]HOK08263.1 NYN domain-containing protein [Candidatus Hydrogenedens sp.]HPP59146.1 NYN domain-containing protein [Candidatus Hydrogenedens sp.]